MPRGDWLLGQQLRVARLERGLTQEAVGVAVGLSGAMISRFELGREQPSRGELRHWREALGITRLTMAKTYAEWVRTRRAALGLAPESLARATRLTVAAILAIESGATAKPQRRTRAAIERALSIHPDVRAPTQRRLRLDRAMPKSAPADFERFATRIVSKANGTARYRVVGRPGDGGIDGVVTRRDGIRIGVQAKRWRQAVSAATIEQLVEAVQNRGFDRGVVATSGRFTASARAAAKRAPVPIRLYSFEQLEQLSIRHGVGLSEGPASKAESTRRGSRVRTLSVTR